MTSPRVAPDFALAPFLWPVFISSAAKTSRRISSICTGVFALADAALLGDRRHPIEVVARETGFGDQERLRRAFLRIFGQSPQALRRMALAKRTEALS